MRRLLLLSEGGGAGKTFAAANLLPLLPGACALELKRPEESELALVTGRRALPLGPASFAEDPAGKLFCAGPESVPTGLPQGAGEGWLIIDGLSLDSPHWQAWLEASGCVLLTGRGDLVGARRALKLARALEAAHFPKSGLAMAWTPAWPAQPLPELPGISAFSLPEFAKAAERQAQSLLPSQSDPFSPLGKACRQLAAALQAIPAPAPTAFSVSAPAPAGEGSLRREALLKALVEDIRRSLDLRQVDSAELASARLRELWTPRVRELAASLLSGERGAWLDRQAKAAIEEELLRLLLGLGPLEPLLDDPEITEIMVNSPSQVYVERGGKIFLSDARFWDEAQLLQVIERIVAPLGRRIDESSPKVDARLPDGSRVNAVIPPLALKGPCLTIRKFSKKRLGVDDLLRLGALSPQAAAFLKSAVLHRRNIVVSGGTGSGKTTLLNALSSFIPADERIVTIEDSAELKLDQEHVVALEARPKNLEGKGEVSIRDLVANSLRMRPDRIVVGECRGGEALDMLQAMNTGHDGSLTTVHANSPRDALSRIETLCLMSEIALPLAAVRRQLASAVELIVQVARLKDGSRRVLAITEITGMEGDTVLSQDLFLFEQKGLDGSGKVLGELKATGIAPNFYLKAREDGYKPDFSLFSKA